MFFNFLSLSLLFSNIIGVSPLLSFRFFSFFFGEKVGLTNLGLDLSGDAHTLLKFTKIPLPESRISLLPAAVGWYPVVSVRKYPHYIRVITHRVT